MPRIPKAVKIQKILQICAAINANLQSSNPFSEHITPREISERSMQT